MRILAIDTSTRHAGVAVIEDENLIAECIMQFKATHSEKLLPEIIHILETTHIPLESIDYYAAVVGPGSFTGLRVGISTLKGLAFVTSKKVVSVSTLEVIAWGFPFCEYQICPLLDARKREVFAALFKWDKNKILRIKDDSVLSIDALVEWIKENTVFTGSGVELYKGKLIEKLGEKAIFAPSLHFIPRPSVVAYIGLQKIKEGFLLHAKDLKPLYLRKSEAEIKLE